MPNEAPRKPFEQRVVEQLERIIELAVNAGVARGTVAGMLMAACIDLLIADGRATREQVSEVWLECWDQRVKKMRSEAEA